MIKEKEEVQYIWLDGATIKEDLLVTMAKRSGNMTLAEHNILALYRQVLIDNGLGEYVKIENDIRSHYNAMPVPVKDSVSTDNTGCCGKDDAIRKVYMKIGNDKRKSIVSNSLKVLMENHQDIFRSKNDWIGIYLVIRDRVNGSLSMAGFYSYAYETVESWWPEHLMIGRRTMSNFARCVIYEDRQEPYYDMENNPWDMLCSVFWQILKQQIMTYE